MAILDTSDPKDFKVVNHRCWSLIFEIKILYVKLIGIGPAVEAVLV